MTTARETVGNKRAKIVRDGHGHFYGIRFDCPNADCVAHVLPVSWLPPGEDVESPHVADKPHWTFNGDFNRPSFAPSVKTEWGIHARVEYGESREVRICHSIVTDGRIEFLSDCTHALAGQTVELPEIE